MTKKILVAVAWPYVNGDLHPGHLAGYLLPADVFARFNRLKGNDVLMVSGSDCHGTPVTVQADKEEVSPLEIVEKYHSKDVLLFKKFGLSYNLYTLTTTANHKQITQEIFIDLLKNGFIKKDVMNQYYSLEDKKFLPDRYVEGTCPHCMSKDQRSDQCENCGRWLKDGELIDPKSKLTGNKVELRETEHYFLDFEKLQWSLEKYVESKKNIWRDWVYAEAMGWLKEGLKARAITRDMDWAIDLPIDEILNLADDKKLSDFVGKKIYVWFEAVIGYLSASIEWSSGKIESKDVIFSEYSGQSKDWREWWLDNNSKHYYFMGQDNLVFHTLMWPGQLIGTEKKYTLPENVVVNKFLTFEGKKFSKSRGWIVDSSKLADTYGVDAIRYYILSNLPEHKESDFTWDSLKAGINNELVANLGNFIHRTLSFFYSKMNGNLQAKYKDIDEEVKKQIDSTFLNVEKHLAKAEFVNALNSVMQLSRFGNKYFDEKKIWKVVKENAKEAQTIMLNLLNLVQNFSVLINPFLPESSEKLREILNLNNIQPEVNKDQWIATFTETFKIGSVPSPLFKKIEEIISV